MLDGDDMLGIEETVNTTSALLDVLKEALTLDYERHSRDGLRIGLCLAQFDTGWEMGSNLEHFFGEVHAEWRRCCVDGAIRLADVPPALKEKLRDLQAHLRTAAAWAHAMGTALASRIGVRDTELSAGYAALIEAQTDAMLSTLPCVERRMP